MIRHDDTIAAIATPPGEGGIGIIRVSGPAAAKVVTPLWRGQRPIADFASHKLYHGPLVDPGSGCVIDEVLAVWMRAPRSYTGEEVVEIQAHGGPVLLEQILGLVLAQGARLARPGEFTERAFLNGRIDLSQAEGVADLISAQSELSVRLANDHIGGRLSKAIDKLRNELVVMRAQVEAMLDFPEDEDVQVLHYDEIGERGERLGGQIRRWLAGFEEGRRRREGVRVVLAGRPNVGKSSLFNALLSEDRAIVHPVAGTTRDVIEAAVSLNGLLVRLFDTAGLREAQTDTVESEGIRRSWQQIEQADLVLFVIDASVPWNGEDERHYEAIRERPHRVVANKCDLVQNFSSPLRGEEPALSLSKGQGGGGPEGTLPGAPSHQGRGREIRISALYGDGLDSLKAAIFETLLPHGKMSGQWLLANQRHKLCLEKTLACLEQVQSGAARKIGLELIAADLLVAANHLGEITGEITHDEILDEIFSRFCLGK